MAREATSKARKSTGTRYSLAERRKILAYAAERGRGGLAAASRKFGVNYRSIARWASRGESPESAPRTGTPRRGRPPRTSQGGDRTLDALRRMAEIRRELQQLQGEYDRLRSQL